MTSFKQRTDIAAIKVDKDEDIIPISVGLYKLFLAGGAAGIEAKTLYEHLIFTARLQETQQVFANNEYLRSGLQWGLAKVKKAKAWLVTAGLIEYVQYRDAAGTLSEVYIRIKFMLSRETLNEKLSHVAPDGWTPPAAPEAATSPEDQYSFDFTEAATDISCTVVEVNFTAGTVTAPPVDRTTGAERQMLESNNQMLETKNEMSVSPASAESVDPVSESIDRALTEAGTSRPFQIRPNQTEAVIAEKAARMLCRLWYARYHKETARMQLPGAQDLTDATKVVYQFPELLKVLSGADSITKAVDHHFDFWRGAWFLITEQTRRMPEPLQKPYWNFRNFCRHFGEILDLENPATTAVPSSSGGDDTVRAKVPNRKSRSFSISDEEIARTIAEAEAINARRDS